MPDLETLGWDDAWAAELEPWRGDGVVAGRVSAPYGRASYDVLTVTGERRARLPGRLRHEARSLADLPVVGDWVALDVDRPDPARIRAVLPRRTTLARRKSPEAGPGAGREQVVAANVDVLFLAVPMPDDPSPALLERYLAFSWANRVRPVLLLTKADLHPSPESAVAAAREVAGDVPVEAVSSRRGVGLDAVRSHVGTGVTGALVGPSGVGKSTLVNALLGDERLATGAVGDGGQGRHTTTRRQLVVLPDGGMLVDNPGVRELYLWVEDEDLDDVFPDIAELARHCRFTDCRHESEPACAVRAALERGDLSPERWTAYVALAREREEQDARRSRSSRPRAGRRRPGSGTS